jgi:hypothetical protein
VLFSKIMVGLCSLIASFFLILGADLECECDKQAAFNIELKEKDGT